MLKEVIQMKTITRTIQLTDDPLKNIFIMTPMLNNKSREAMSYLMYGCFIGEELANANKEQKKQTN